MPYLGEVQCISKEKEREEEGYVAGPRAAPFPSPRQLQARAHHATPRAELYYVLSTFIDLWEQRRVTI